MAAAKKRSDGGGQRRAAETRVGPGGKTAYVAPVVPDPGIRYGDYRVLQRTDDRYIVIDDRRPPGEQVVWISPALHAKAAGHSLIELASAEAKDFAQQEREATK